MLWVKHPVTKYHLLHDFVHWKVQNSGLYPCEKQISGCLGLGKREVQMEMIGNGYGVSFWFNENVPKRTLLMFTRIPEYIKNHFIALFKWVKWVNCVTCELYPTTSVWGEESLYTELFCFEYDHSSMRFLRVPFFTCEGVLPCLCVGLHLLTH